VTQYTHHLRKKVRFKAWRDACADILADAGEPLSTEDLHDRWLQAERKRRKETPTGGATKEPQRYPRRGARPSLIAKDGRFTNITPIRVKGVRTSHNRASWVLNTNHPSPDAE